MRYYATGIIGWTVAYAVTEEAAKDLMIPSDQGAALAALAAWRLLMDAHTERLGRPVGAPTSEPRIRRGRLGVVVARIALGADPAVAEAEEQSGR
jgi:hypothetical protein